MHDVADDSLAVRGAEIIVQKWVQLKANEHLCIVTSALHMREAELLKKTAEKYSSSVSIMQVKQEGIHVGKWFDDHPDVFNEYDVIIGASDYSIVTTKACEKALHDGKKFLSLPLSTNTKKSMLGFDFITMDPDISRIKAEILIRYIKKAKTVHIVTDLGTDLHFGMKNRKPGFFNGTFRDNHSYSSASIEVYIPIEETKTQGILMLDGSYGYLGKVEKPCKILFDKGKIISIENNSSGNKLRKYLESYHDERMYYGGELGLGLNSKSRCAGECYIEDESTYGTFHIGVGRNIGLGGVHEASGHFDLVTWKPSIWFDNRIVMNHGVITIPEFEM
jgi:hypothetical protein